MVAKSDRCVPKSWYFTEMLVVVPNAPHRVRRARQSPSPPAAAPTVVQEDWDWAGQGFLDLPGPRRQVQMRRAGLEKVLGKQGCGLTRSLDLHRGAVAFLCLPPLWVLSCALLCSLPALLENTVLIAPFAAEIGESMNCMTIRLSE